jgi:hypothetical protein
MWLLVCGLRDGRFAPVTDPLVFFAGTFGTVR